MRGGNSMRHGKSRTRNRVTRVSAWAGALVLATAGLSAAAESLASAAPLNARQTAPQHVAYLGHTFTVPSGWSVVNLAKSPTACVRFDVNAIYLGTPSATQKCAARGVSPAEDAILVQPSGTSRGAASAQDDAIEQRITATLANVRITASYGTDRSTVTRILASAGVPTPLQESVPIGIPALPLVRAAVAPGAATGATLTTVNRYVGLGFDACTAPSTAQMSSWGTSPYEAIGVYIGGADRACSQPELTESWVTTEVAAGWHLLPIYAGPQVDTAPSQLTGAASQGTAAANDAVTQAKALGLGQGSLLYYDMEGGGFTAADSTAVEAFLNTWTARLHALGYESAVYGQENGALGVLTADWGKMAEPDAIDVDNPNGLEDDDPGADPANHWLGYRVHQFVANTTQTYGGVSIAIDEDYLGLFGACQPTGSGGGVVRPHYVQPCSSGVEPAN